MTQLTIGQRIAAQRKLHGLSQEALSEELGVSRQAISKWESDAAIPEIDKLIILSRIFGVSVGWLLGTEKESTFNPEDGLSDAQAKMVEEIVTRYREAPPRKMSRSAVALLVCLLAAVAAAFLYAGNQISVLSHANDTAQSQIDSLTQSNQSIQSQLNEMRTLLDTQNETSKVLRSHVPLCYLSDDLKSAEVQFYFFPKLYQENVTAYLSILNPAAGVKELLECKWMQDRYMVNAVLPLADHYQYSFLLVSDTGYQEELLERGTYFSDLLTHSAFFIGETDPKYHQMMAGESAVISEDETVYRYHSPLHVPCIQEKNGLMPFRDVTISLTHNGALLWQEDYTEQFRDIYAEAKILSDPVFPDIEVELPELQEGDRLVLELTATTFTDRTLVTRLDDLTVTTPDA